MSYVSKYIAKKNDDAVDGHTGRWWGVYRRDLLPMDVVEIFLEAPEFHRLRRVFRQWLASKGYDKKPSTKHQGIRGFVGWLAAMRLIELLD